MFVLWRVLTPRSLAVPRVPWHPCCIEQRIHARLSHKNTTARIDNVLTYHAGQNDYRYRSEIKSKTIGLYQITDVTDLN